MKGRFAGCLLAGPAVVAVLLSSCVNRNIADEEEWGILDGFDECVGIAVPTEKMERFDLLVERSADIRLVRIIPSPSGIASSVIDDGLINVDRLEKLRSVSRAELDLLAQTLFGYTDSFVRIRCYEPRHGILFVDKDENPSEFLEICLACNQLYSLHDLLKVSPLLCPDQKVALEGLFEEP